MKKICILFLLTITLFSYGSYGQNTQPTKQETFEYFRGKLLSLKYYYAHKGDIKDISYNEKDCIFEIFYDNVFKDEDEIFFGNLDANNITWEISNDKAYLIMTIVSKGGFFACYHFSNDYLQNKPSFATFYFNTYKAADIPDFQERMSKAVKRLIELCGGKKEDRDPFAH